MLEQGGYHLQTLDFCPTEMGWPNRRPRFYLVAGLDRPVPWRAPPVYRTDLGAFLDARGDEAQELWVDPGTAERYWSALHRVIPHGSQQETACFTASYGKYLLHSGSYLQMDKADGRPALRRFSPRETARLLGFPDSFRLDELKKRSMWKMLGNSLSLPAARYILSHLPHGPSPALPWRIGN